jgi:hypothetical protein
MASVPLQLEASPTLLQWVGMPIHAHAEPEMYISARVEIFDGFAFTL